MGYILSPGIELQIILFPIRYIYPNRRVCPHCVFILLGQAYTILRKYKL